MVRAFGCVSVVVLLAAPVFGQAADAPPAFESADVHVIPANGFGVSMAGGVLRAGRYEIRAATMVDLVKTAYGVDDDKVVGGPSWLETDRFDVIAKAPAGATADTAKVMLQNLLADRFGLTVHKDNKPMPAYLLAAGKGAPKLKPASGSGQTGCQGQPQPLGPPVPGFIVNIIVSCHNLMMAAFADQLHQMAGGVDTTGLQGGWDFVRSWTPKGALHPAQAGNVSAGLAADPGGLSVFEAIDKELGLKLEAGKHVIPVTVIDHMELKPVESPLI